jgi:hypothetical protein
MEQQLRRFRVPTGMKEAFVAWMVRNGRYMTIWNERSPRARFPAGAWGRNELIFAWLQLVPRQAAGEAEAVGAGLAGTSIVTFQVDERLRGARFGRLRPRPARRAPLAGV